MDLEDTEKRWRCRKHFENDEALRMAYDDLKEKLSPELLNLHQKMQSFTPCNLSPLGNQRNRRKFEEGKSPDKMHK